MVVHQLPKLTTRVRFPLPAFSFSRAAFFLLLASGCASTSTSSIPLLPIGGVQQAVPQQDGFYYQVKPKETLWTIANRYGLDAKQLSTINRIPDPGQLSVGQRLFIPNRQEIDGFLWPLRGRASRAKRLGGSTDYGLSITAASGSFARATRSGRISVAASDVAGWGKTIVIDHGDGYLSVYSQLDQLLVSPGSQIRQGTPVGLVGSDPLYFEIRYGTQPRDPMQLLR